jgi:hypothetical protein
MSDISHSSPGDDLEREERIRLWREESLRKLDAILGGRRAKLTLDDFTPSFESDRGDMLQRIAEREASS